MGKKCPYWLRNERLALMNNYIEQYTKALFKLRKYTDSTYISGSLIYKKCVKNINGKRYEYLYSYWETTVHKEGRRSRTRKYVPKAEVGEYEEMVVKRNAYKKKLRELSREVKMWIGKLYVFVKHGMVKLDVIVDNVDEMLMLDKIKEDDAYEKMCENEGSKDFRVLTENDELVRSKNEALFVCAVCSEDVEYLYEPSIPLNREFGGNTVRYIKPDFILFPREKPIYVEILGMMDIKKYRDEWERRLVEYERKGIRLGRNLVCLVCVNKYDINYKLMKKTVANMKKGIIPQKPVYLGLDNIRTGSYRQVRWKR